MAFVENQDAKIWIVIELVDHGFTLGLLRISKVERGADVVAPADPVADACAHLSELREDDRLFFAGQDFVKKLGEEIELS